MRGEGNKGGGRRENERVGDGREGWGEGGSLVVLNLEREGWNERA